MRLDQRRLDRQKRRVRLLIGRVQPPQFAGDRQNALQIQFPGRDREVRPGLFLQSGEALRAEKSKFFSIFA